MNDNLQGKGKLVGGFLIGLSLIGALSAFLNIVTGRQTNIFIIMTALGFAGIAGMMGMAFLLLHKVDKNVREAARSLAEPFNDDWEDLYSGRLTWTHGYVLLTIVAVVATVWLMTGVHKWNSQWFGIPVWLIGIIAGLVTSWLFTLSDWFKTRWEHSSQWLFIVPAVGLVICAVVGLYFTEPAFSDHRTSTEYSYGDSRIGYWYYNYYPHYFSGSSDTSTSSSSSSSCGKGCGEGLIFLIILLAVLAFVVCSATVPHFWVAALIILSCWLGMIALRELLYVPYKRGRRSLGY